MRIIVRDGEHNLNIPFPTGLMVNGLTARVACAALRTRATWQWEFTCMTSGKVRKFGEIPWLWWIRPVSGILPAS